MKLRNQRRTVIAGAGISPVGYFRLGASAPRLRARQYYWQRRPFCGGGDGVVGTLVGVWSEVLTVRIDDRRTVARIDSNTLEAEIQK